MFATNSTAQNFIKHSPYAVNSNRYLVLDESSFVGISDKAYVVHHFSFKDGSTHSFQTLTKN